MIIWKGHGILIPIFAILGSTVLGMAFAAAYGATHWEWVLRMVKPATAWGAVLAIWLYGRTIGKTVTKTYLDPATHQQVIIKKSHSFFFIGPMIWAAIAGLMACFATVESFKKSSAELQSEYTPKASSPAATAFKEANNLIDMDKGKTAYGNTPDAEKLAEAFSQAVMMGREMGVEKTQKKSRISLSHGKFLSYCRINPDSCAFMVHVPDLRKFTEEAKRYMVEMAWSVASLQAAELKPRPKRVAVGVRGAFLYDEVVEGPVPDDKALAASVADDDWAAGIEHRYSGNDATKRLEPYFEPHAPGAVLPTLEGGSEMAENPAKEGHEEAAKTQAQAKEELDRLIKQLEAMQPGQAEGNTPAAREVAAAYAKAVWDGFPFPRRLSDNVPHFAAHVHLRSDTAAILLGLPGEGQMPPGGFVSVEPVAWKIAALACEKMTPRPTRMALILFMDGQLMKSYISARSAKEWRTEEEIEGASQTEKLLPFFTPVPDGGTITVIAENSTASSSPGKPALAPPATAPAPSPLPTSVRDWKDTTGRVMQASLESFTTPAKDAGRFKRADGQMFEVPFARLSAEDQEFIRGIAAP